MKRKATAPSVFLKLLSIIPFFNFLSLACMGIQVKRIVHTLFAVLYGVLFFTLDTSQNPSIAMLLWLLPTCHFWCAYASVIDKAKLPGKLLCLFSFIPFFSIIALIGLGVKAKKPVYAICGTLYMLWMCIPGVTIASPLAPVVLWIIPMVQFWVVRTILRKSMNHAQPPITKAEETNAVATPANNSEQCNNKHMADTANTACNDDRMTASNSAASSTAIELVTVMHSAETAVSNVRIVNQSPDIQTHNVAVNYSSVTLDGTEEKNETLPQSSSQSYTYIGSTYSGLPSYQKFMQDMRHYADMSGKKVDFVPFMAYWPTYDSMNTKQKAWYLYWRTQVREKQYPDTDLSYIFVYIYELLSGIGWKKPADGQNMLLALWNAYRGRYPKLDSYLTSWVFDFAQQHQLSYQVPDGCPLCMDQASVQADILIDRYSDSVPLKLPFDLIDALCDYALAKSKFYLDGHEQLMREAIPRVVALADAALRKKGKNGILAVYGPNRPKRQEYIMYSSALCPSANQRVEINVKAYTSSSQLRGYINELVRYGENVLRELNNCRGRLRGITLDDETAALVDSFLKKEYGQTKAVSDPLIGRITAQGIRYVDYRSKDGCLWLIGGQELNSFVKTLAKEGVTFTFKAGGGHVVNGDAWWTRDTISASQQPPSHSERRVFLDFTSIEALREQSDQVREALRVEESQPEKPLLTDLKEVTAIYQTVSAQGQQLLRDLGAAEWEMKVPTDTIAIDEINREARRILGCSILHNEHNLLIAEDDYRDELAEVLSCLVVESVNSTTAENTFGEPIQEFLAALSPEQRQALSILLYSQQISADLEQLAEQNLSMPQMLLDDLNEAALNSIGEIIIDTLGDTPCILDEYFEPLKSADKLEV